MKIIITGIAGFIGFHLAKRLAEEGHEITGIDNLNDYYDPALKIARLAELGIQFKEEKQGTPIVSKHLPITFFKTDVADKNQLEVCLKGISADIVIHLAAQAGVRYSIQAPEKYISSNINGFFNMLEWCRNNPVKHLVFASSSSVYGLNRVTPFREEHHVAHPISLYAATKRSGELMAHTYSHLFNIPITCLRFFTVYGPWGRPDMAYFSFTKKILSGEAIEIFNHGKLKRDFTYVDDIVEGVSSVIGFPPTPGLTQKTIDADPGIANASFRILNIGNNTPEKLETFVSLLEKHLGKKALKKYLPMQAGDALETYADISRIHQLTGFVPKTSLDEGLKNFIQWYREYYGELA